MADDEFRDTVTSANLEDRLYCFRGEEATVSSNNEGKIFGERRDRGEDGLDKVLRVVLEDDDYLPRSQ